MQDQGSAASKRTIASALERRRLAEREQIMEAMLALSGEVGYEHATVGRVLELSGGNLGQFYASFDNRSACFVAAHEAELERLYVRMRDAAVAEADWADGLRAALTALFAFAVEQPLIARALFSEVYAAGGPALDKHEEFLERLSRAVDGACRETSESRHTPPPATASFMVGAIEELVRSRLVSGPPEQLWGALPELMHLVVLPYRGEQAARAELRRPVSHARTH
jgi:AcrR family transcriptional regulator